MKRVLIAFLAMGLALPMIAAPASCVAQDTLGPTVLKLFANPACLQQYGFVIPQ